MTGSAKNQRLSFSCGHNLDPAWLLPTVIGLQIFECPDVMHFYLISKAGCLTYFAYLCQESFFQFRSTAPFPCRPVFYGCLHIPGECDSAPSRYQWFLSFTMDHDLKHLVSLPFHFDFRLVFLVDFPHGGFVLGVLLVSIASDALSWLSPPACIPERVQTGTADNNRAPYDDAG